MVGWVWDQLGKKISCDTVRRILKAAGYTWRRMRKSLKKQRDKGLFAFFQEELTHLKQMDSAEQIDLYFFDETGFNLAPNVPYAWQPKGKTALLPAQRGKSLTTLGFLSSDMKFKSYLFEGAISAEIVCRVFDDFSQKLNRKTVLILDNASIHKAAIIHKNMNKWKQRGLFLQFIPAYSPELNHIEILWRFVKHQWLEPWHYENIEVLKENLIHIFQNIGQKYRITFT